MTKKINFITALPIVLIIAGNLLPLVGRLFWGWDTFYLLALYWVDTVVVYFFNYLKMRKAEGSPSTEYYSAESKKERIGGYLFIGTIFLAILGLQIIFFSTFLVRSTHLNSADSAMTLPPLDIINYGIALLFLIGGSAMSYLNFVKKGIYKTISVAEAQGSVFGRIVLMFVVIFISVFAFGPTFNIRIFPIILFVILKSAGDILGYYLEVYRREQAAS